MSIANTLAINRWQIPITFSFMLELNAHLMTCRGWEHSSLSLIG
ncbi:MAG: hypothetical protein ACJ70Z_09825 [Nitrososphaera sp.]